MTGYCGVRAVNERLRFSDDERDSNATLISAKIDDAYRIICQKFAAVNSSAPDPTGSYDEILEDINADLAAALYREDVIEFTDLAGERPFDKSWTWKKRAMEMLKEYIMNYARPQTDSDLYVKKVN